MTIGYRLQCPLCSATYEMDSHIGYCVCGGGARVTYDFASQGNTIRKEQVISGPASLWRYKSLLPIRGEPVTLGEGFTPLLPLRRLGANLGYSDLWLKEEGQNPAGSSVARGMSVAVSAARELGATEFAVPSAADEASAVALYAAAAGLKAHIFTPSDISKANYVAAMAAGAAINLVDGSLTACSREASERNRAEGWFDFANVTEPYRIEGQKTVGFEIAEQFAWAAPDAIVLPAGGEVAISKAFHELEQLGWIDGKRPKIMEIAIENRRSAIDAAIEFIRIEGIFVSPETGACIAALRDLLQAGELKASGRVVVLNPASGFKSSEAYGTRFIRSGGGDQDKLGGLILPR
jgi:threonine synthase